MLWALALFWTLGAAGAIGYAQFRGISMNMTLGLLPAFLLEATLFLAFGLERERTRLERFRPVPLALGLAGAALAPYVLATLYLGNFSWRALGILAVLSGLVAFWYVVLPHNAGTDALFLLFVGTVAFTRIIREQYPDPHPRLPLGILGQMMWIRTAGCALLCIRKVKGIGFGFWPDARHWKTGAIYYFLMLMVLAPVAWLVNFGAPHAPAIEGWRIPVLAVGTFFGILWVTALGEEFLFRGLLQQWFTKWASSETVGLVLASVLFGVIHLWTPRGRFPDVQLAILAAIAGAFYGLAFRSAKSVRASMVTHALTVTTWRLFFS